MSHFYLSGHTTMKKSPTTARGSKKSGLSCHVRGWNKGIFIQAFHKDGKDIFEIYETSGSNNTTFQKKIETIEIEET